MRSRETGKTQNAEEPNPQTEPATLRFGGGMVAVAGVFGGLAIALGVPAVLLSLGQNLGQVVLTILVVLAIAGGGLICLVSAFFGLVMPRRLRGGPWMDPDRWRRFAQLAREQHRWHHGPRGPWGRGPWDGGGEDRDEDHEDDAAAPRARRARGARRP